MNAAVLIAVAVTLPLALALVLPWRRLRGAALAAAPAAALPALALALYATDAQVQFVPPWLLLGTALGLDDTARVFLLFTALLWTVGALYGRAWLASDPERWRFFAFYLAAAAGNLGVVLAQDVVGFYCCFALMTFAAYGFILHERTAATRRAATVYLVLALAGEAALLAAFLLIADAGGFRLAEAPAAVAASPWRDAIVALLLVGFGVKTGVLGLHMALPLAYAAAPVPGAAVLASAMIKAGLLGWLRFLPLGEAALPAWGAAFIALGVAAAFYGVAVGLTQTDPRSLLAYSSVSQMGFITVGVGAALAAPHAWPLVLPAVTLYALHHAFAKGALFLGTGVAQRSASWRRWIGLGLLGSGLALAGAPFTSGLPAKLYLQDALAPLPAPWPEWLGVLLALAAAGTMALMLRLLTVLDTPGASGRAPVSLWLSWMALAAAPLLVWLVLVASAPALRVKALSAAVLPAALGPVAAGVLTAGLLWLAYRRGIFTRVPVVPAGDVLAPAQRLGRRMRALAQLGSAALVRSWRHRLLPVRRRWHERAFTAVRTEWVEVRLRSWHVFGTLGLLLAAALFLLLALA